MSAVNNSRVIKELTNNDFVFFMIEIGVDETAIATAVMGNIALYLGIQIQKYAKKKIIELALNGISTSSFQQLWSIGVALLIISECAYFIAYGLGSDSQMLPLGVFTIISNTTLLPLLFKSESGTMKGSLLCQLGILLMTVVTPTDAALTSQPHLALTSNLAYYSFSFEIIVGLILVFIRAYHPANCSLKIAANSGLSALMGSHAGTLTRILFSEDDIGLSPSIIATGIMVTFLLEVVFIYESLQLFPVWQVVSHHFVLFTFFIFFNKAMIFDEFAHVSRFAKAVLWISHFILIGGVWIAAKPHLDIPPNIADAGLMPELEARVLANWNEEGRDSQNAHSNMLRRQSTDLCTPWGQECLRIEYCQLMHAELKNREGICGFN